MTTAAVIVPARDPGPALARCLAALAGQDVSLVDDASDPPLAKAPGVRLLRMPEHGGPARARNRGAEASKAEVLVFVDADVEVAPDTVERLLDRLAAHPDAAAVQAVYTPDAPEGSGFATRLMALVQHTNFTAVADPERFMGLSSYCIAVRAADFRAAGGFDEQVHRATVEDDNLAHALLSLGRRIVLAPDIEVRHLAHYTVGGMLRRMARMASDKVVAVRRVPARGRLPLRNTHHRAELMLAAALAPAALLVLPISPPVAGLLAGIVVAAHHRVLRMAWRREGLVFAAGAAGAVLGLGVAAGAGSVHGVIRAVASPE